MSSSNNGGNCKRIGDKTVYRRKNPGGQRRRKVVVRKRRNR